MFEPCRPYHELKFKKCQLREYKEIQNMDEQTALATRKIAEKSLRGNEALLKELMSWRY